MKFVSSVEELTAWGACAPALEKLPIGQEMTLHFMADNLPFENIFWYLTHVINKGDPLVLACVRRWVAALGGHLPAQFTLPQLFQEVHNHTVSSVRDMNRQGVGTREAYKQIKEKQMAEMFKAFGE